MEQELISNINSVGIIGGGPAGCTCAKFLYDAGINITIFEKNKLLQTLLPTGGGRCNLAHAEYDFKELAKNYPRGEKFLYSIFSKFSTQDTLDFFDSIGVKTYTQEKDNRIFPQSNSASEVREKILKSINCNIINQKVINITSDTNKKYKITTTQNEYFFDAIIIAIGGHSNFDIIKNLGIDIIPPEQSLVGFVTKENYSTLSGVSLKNITAKIEKRTFTGDLIFTHQGVSGPLIYQISSVFVRKQFPYIIDLQLIPEIDLQKILNQNPHKEIKNILGKFIPKSLAEFILKNLNILPEQKAHLIDSQVRNIILSKLQNFEITISGKLQDGEIVTCGGVNLKEINPKTLESKSLYNLYFCGEVLDIDGFCGGFNLQNCWSTGYICATSILNKLNHSSQFPAKDI